MHLLSWNHRDHFWLKTETWPDTVEEGVELVVNGPSGSTKTKLTKEAGQQIPLPCPC